MSGNKKQSFRKRTRMYIAFFSCFPVFLVLSALLKGAQGWLVFLINLIVGGTIVFTVFLIGEHNDEIREQMHEEYMKELEKSRRTGIPVRLTDDDDDEETVISESDKK